MYRCCGIGGFWSETNFRTYALINTYPWPFWWSNSKSRGVCFLVWKTAKVDHDWLDFLSTLAKRPLIIRPFLGVAKNISGPNKWKALIHFIDDENVCSKLMYFQAGLVSCPNDTNSWTSKYELKLKLKTNKYDSLGQNAFPLCAFSWLLHMCWLPEYKLKLKLVPLSLARKQSRRVLKVFQVK